MGVLNFEADAKRAFDAMVAGGVAILPQSVGYSLIAATPAALRRIFDTKRRAPSKLNAMLGNDAMTREVYRLSSRGREVVDAITRDYELPLGCVAPFHADHPIFGRFDADTMARSTKDGTLLMLLNAGHFHAAITRLSHAANLALFGSSANLSLTGTKFSGAEIEPEIRAIAEVVIDYGLMRYHPYRQSSTIIDVEKLEVVRFGSCYEDIRDIVGRHFKVALPPRPAS
jgi:tRNA A37 threonylcarbamoyladenosine synthetase subunit TsaC/SUA5/YrdC